MSSEDRNQGENPYIPLASFEYRQRKYFTDLLGRKWECDIPGHTICVPTEDNQHHQLSDENFVAWVDALCLGKATTSQPPDGILTSISSADGLSTSVVRAVSIPPSHRRNIRSPTLVATSSIREGLSSHPSSGVAGPGYYSGKAIKWFGQKCIDGIENVIIFKRCWQYQYRLKRWASPKGGAAVDKRDKQFFAMLGDLLELSRDCYSERVKKRACSIADRANQLALNPASTIDRKKALTWRMNCMLCFVPIDLTFYYGAESSSELDCIYDLRDTLTKVPLDLQDTQAATEVIRILGSELLYSTQATRLICSQGFQLCNVLSAILSLRQLTLDEMRVIYSLTMRRLERYEEMSSIFCQPWEVAIVGLCSLEHPMLEDMLQGSSGLPSLILALDILLDIDIHSSPASEDYLTAMADVLEALRWLAHYGWVAEVATRGVVARLVDVLLRQIGTFAGHYNALSILDYIFAHRPGLLDDFVHLGGETILPETVSFIKRQPPPNSEYTKYIRSQSMGYVNKIRQRIEQGHSID